MATQSPIERLSDDELRLILDYVEADPDKTVKVDQRPYLSQESFAPPPRPSEEQTKDVAKFRGVCRRFAEIGLQQQFSKIATRLSSQGLNRLEKLAEWPNATRHVKKFSYMVPYFYEGRDRPLELPASIQTGLETFDIRGFNRKVREQRLILTSKEDLRVLKKAIASFSSLQHVQILRVQDRDDSALITYMRQHGDAAPLVDLQWAPACSHSTHTIGTALLESNVPWCHFSSPMLSPQSAMVLARHTPRSFSTLAERLTCLELHFDDGNDLDRRMLDLSELFKTVFTAAVNMQAVHVGFPTHRPLSLPLETLFHHVRWEKLLAFGIQGWRLDADEIIDLALRHSRKLKGLRLRDVLLKEGSRWRDVLTALRNSMERLDWVSLRRIGYARQFDEQWAGAGAEVPDDPPGGESDSDSEDEREDGDDGVEVPSEAGPSHAPGTAQDDWDSDGHSDSHSDSDDEHGPAAHEMDFPPLHSPATPASAPWCNCNNHLDNADDLQDDEGFVSNAKRKAWEKWVVRRCPEHSQR